LPKAGLNVLVLERRDIVGGACITEELFPGYQFSACSYYCYLMQTKVIEDLELRRHGFQVSRFDPLKCLYPDGRALMTWENVERTRCEPGYRSPVRGPRREGLRNDAHSRCAGISIGVPRAAL
jgi:phytoene dehydrogenase-like protein